MEPISGLQQFLGIVTQPDNIPIMAMMLLVLFFTYLGLKQARRNDQLIERGHTRQDRRRDEEVRYRSFESLVSLRGHARSIASCRRSKATRLTLARGFAATIFAMLIFRSHISTRC